MSVHFDSEGGGMGFVVEGWLLGVSNDSLVVY